MSTVQRTETRSRDHTTEGGTAATQVRLFISSSMQAGTEDTGNDRRAIDDPSGSESDEQRCHDHIIAKSMQNTSTSTSVLTDKQTGRGGCVVL